MFKYFTAYETPDGHLECRHHKIAKQYLTGYFPLDVIASVPFDKLLEAFKISPSGLDEAGKLAKLPRLIKILRIARLLKVLRLYRFKKWIRDIQLHYSVHEGVTRLLNIVIIVLFATHLVACLWHAIGVELDVATAYDQCDLSSIVENGLDTTEQGWVCREEMIEKSKGNKYIASLYWSFSTLTTVGYGEFTDNFVHPLFLKISFLKTFLFRSLYKGI